MKPHFSEKERPNRQFPSVWGKDGRYVSHRVRATQCGCSRDSVIGLIGFRRAALDAGWLPPAAREKAQLVRRKTRLSARGRLGWRESVP